MRWLFRTLYPRFLRWVLSDPELTFETWLRLTRSLEARNRIYTGEIAVRDPKTGLFVAQCTGPKDFEPRGIPGWQGRGVLAKFDNLHGLDVLVSEDTFLINERSYKNKCWFTDADEVFFRRGKQIKLYWREKRHGEK